MSVRVLFYVQHLLGVGHVKRAAAIARGMCAQGLDVCVALGGEPVGLADFGGARIAQLPSARAADVSFKTILDQRGRPIDAAWRARRREALLALAAAFRPHILLVEHYPFGRRKFAFELEPLFERMRAQATPILCSVRDVLVAKSDPEQCRRIVATVRAWYDRILVHGDPAMIAFGDSFPGAAALADLITYTGYVVDGPAPAPAASRQGIVVSVGGGAVGERLLPHALEAAASGALAPHHWHVLVGPNLPEGSFQALAARAGPAVRIERARADFRALLAGAALSISQAGYNTLMDILTSRCPAVVVPFAAPGESEQLQRARAFEHRGLLCVLEERELCANTLIEAAEAALGAQPPRIAIDLAGAQRTAEIVAAYGRGRQ